MEAAHVGTFFVVVCIVAFIIGAITAILWLMIASAVLGAFFFMVTMYES